MITKELLTELKSTIAIAPDAGVAGTTDIEGATLDMANFLGVLIEVVFGAITANAVTGITVQQSANSSMSPAETLTALTQVVADDADNKAYVLDCFKPTKRYVRVHIDRATQNAVVASATYKQYGSRVVPITSHGTGVTAASAVSPAGA